MSLAKTLIKLLDLGLCINLYSIDLALLFLHCFLHLLQLVFDQSARLMHFHDFTHCLLCVTGAEGLNELLYDFTVLLRDITRTTLSSKLILQRCSSLLGLFKLLPKFLIIRLH